MQGQSGIQYSPQYGDFGNVIKNQKSSTKDGANLTILFQCSDPILSEFQGYSQKLRSLRVQQLQIMRKDLDKPLSFMKSFFAKVVSIKQEHQFLLIRTQHFLATVDYYINNRLLVRIGDPVFVFDCNKSQARKKSTLVREQSGVQWRRIVKNTEELTLGNILELLLHHQIKDFSQISYTGSHFSRQIYNIIQFDLIKPH